VASSKLYNGDMSNGLIPALKSNQTPEAMVRSEFGGAGWQLEIPPGPKGKYRLAQLDDYTVLPRSSFPWHPPLILRLRARVSAPDISGTWGFGLWNDPFSLSLGFGGGCRRFPALPNAAWFFFASPQSYLSFCDHQPAQGFLAQTFRSLQIPAPILALAALGLPLLAWPWMARRLRPLFRRVIAEDAFTLETFQVLNDLEGLDVTRWHDYSLKWEIDRVTFRVDDQIFETAISPKPPLGLVIWIDNQYAAFPPDGRLSYGILANSQSAWLEIQSLALTKG
jgi:hypothetical protein